MWNEGKIENNLFNFLLAGQVAPEGIEWNFNRSLTVGRWEGREGTHLQVAGLWRKILFNRRQMGYIIIYWTLKGNGQMNKRQVVAAERVKQVNVTAVQQSVTL